MTARVIGGGYEEERDQKNEGNGIRKRELRASLGEETYWYTAKQKHWCDQLKGNGRTTRRPSFKEEPLSFVFHLRTSPQSSYQPCLFVPVGSPALPLVHGGPRADGSVTLDRFERHSHLPSEITTGSKVKRFSKKAKAEEDSDLIARAPEDTRLTFSKSQSSSPPSSYMCYSGGPHR